MSEGSVTVRLDQRLGGYFALGGAAIGFGAGFAVDPVVSWLIERAGGAPAPLRLLSELPLVGEVALLTVLGAVAGWFVFGMWSDEVAEVTVSDAEITVKADKNSTRFERAEIDQAFLDKDDLVLADSTGRELIRCGSDAAIAGKLREALERHGYEWAGTSNPWDDEFVTWVDRGGDLSESEHGLLRSRRRALADAKPGAAEEARDELATLGLMVRDRGEEQQYRRVH